MNRTDRLMAIVLELQRRPGRHRRAADLAATFEVSVRTIYRDVQALCEAGVPVVALERRGYALSEGYFLPPLSFTADEALILALGSDAMADSFDDHYRRAAQSAARKVDAALPKAVRERVAQLRRQIRVSIARRPEGARAATLRQLRRAVDEGWRVRIAYEAEGPGGSARTVREVDPVSLTRLASDWYLAGYCYLRRAARVFRLSRIVELAVLGERAAETGAEALGWAEVLGREQRFVLVEVDAGAAQRARESPLATVVDEQQVGEAVQLTLLTHAGQDLVPWLLGLGPAARVLEPPELRAAVVAQAQALLARYREEPTEG